MGRIDLRLILLAFAFCFISEANALTIYTKDNRSIAVDIKIERPFELETHNNQRVGAIITGLIKYRIAF
jgi:hypothetical protein